MQFGLVVVYFRIILTFTSPEKNIWGGGRSVHTRINTYILLNHDEIYEQNNFCIRALNMWIKVMQRYGVYNVFIVHL